MNQEKQDRVTQQLKNIRAAHVVAPRRGQAGVVNAPQFEGAIAAESTVV
jgi:hypothetical protein